MSQTIDMMDIREEYAEMKTKGITQFQQSKRSYLLGTKIKTMK